MSKEIKKNRKNLKILLGLIPFLVGFSILLLTYWPLLKAYYSHRVSPTTSNINISLAGKEEEITRDFKRDTTEVFVDREFGIYIPKIKSNSKVVKNVDPFNESEYTQALKTGVAHSKTTKTPDRKGNVFLFAHSAVNFYERNQYDVYFYLLGELEEGDEIYVSYEGEIYKYKVGEVKVVNKEDTKYLGNYSNDDTLTLMTCYPAGTDWKRTIVIAYRY